MRAGTGIATRPHASWCASIDAVLEHDFDRVIMSRGRVLETGGKDALRAAF
jgi:hypothetical protein